MAAPLVATLVLALAACGSTGAGSDPPISHPGGDALVFRIENSGGFVTPEFLFGNLPALTLIGDGRVIVPGAQDAIFPGPALPAIQERTLTAEGVDSVLRLVAASGQFGSSAEWRGAQAMVADAGDTIFTLHADGRDVTVTVYALGAVGPGNGVQGISAAELAAHRALSSLAEQLGAPEIRVPSTAWTAAWHPYLPDALRLLIRNVDGMGPDPSGLPSQELPWPTSADPAAFGAPTAFDPAMRCGVVAADDARAWLDALAGANQITRWVAGEHRYSVTARPLLPDEPRTCEANA